MNKYRVLIEGKRLPLVVDDKIKMHGFFTTRFVEGVDVPSAKEKALGLVTTELQQVISDSNNMPSIVVEDVAEIESFEGINVPGSGFSLFPEEGE